MPNMMTNRRMYPSFVYRLSTQYRNSHALTSRAIAPLVLVATLLLAACGGDSGTGPATTATVAGTYNLTTVQGKSLPYRVYSETNYSLDVARGSMLLNSNGSFTAAMRSEERVQSYLSVYDDTATGTWVLNGSKIDITTSDGLKQSAVLSGKTLTVTDSTTVVPLVFVYTMQ
jgi:hypothetical protein